MQELVAKVERTMVHRVIPEAAAEGTTHQFREGEKVAFAGKLSPCFINLFPSVGKVQINPPMGATWSEFVQGPISPLKFGGHFNTEACSQSIV